MIGRNILLKSKNLIANPGLQLVRQAHHDTGGIPGQNLPFQIKNIYRLTAWFGFFIGSGLAAPFLILRHQLKKQ